MAEMENTRFELEVNGKWTYCGTLVTKSRHGQDVAELHTIHLKHAERFYRVHVSLSMLSAYGGDFDEDDTVYADIYAIDGKKRGHGWLRPTRGPVDGYVWGRHFGFRGDDENMGPTVYAGRINQELTVRLFVMGDNWAAATYVVEEL